MDEHFCRVHSPATNAPMTDQDRDRNTKMEDSTSQSQLETDSQTGSDITPSPVSEHSIIRRRNKQWTILKMGLLHGHLSPFIEHVSADVFVRHTHREEQLCQHITHKLNGCSLQLYCTGTSACVRNVRNMQTAAAFSTKRLTILYIWMRKRVIFVHISWTSNMWPWSTKPVIKVNFEKLRFMHHLKAE